MPVHSKIVRPPPAPIKEIWRVAKSQRSESVKKLYLRDRLLEPFTFNFFVENEDEFENQMGYFQFHLFPWDPDLSSGDNKTSWNTCNEFVRKSRASEDPKARAELKEYTKENQDRFDGWKEDLKSELGQEKDSVSSKRIEVDLKTKDLAKLRESLHVVNTVNLLLPTGLTAQQHEEQRKVDLQTIVRIRADKKDRKKSELDELSKKYQGNFDLELNKKINMQFDSLIQRFDVQQIRSLTQLRENNEAVEWIRKQPKKF